VDGLLLVTDFLQLNDISTTSVDSMSLVNLTNDAKSAASALSVASLDEPMQHVLNSMRLCNLEYTRRSICGTDEACSASSESNTDITPASSGEKTEPTVAYLRNDDLSQQSSIPDCVHDAYLIQMTERDRAQAKYAALRVLHRHELKQHKVKQEQLRDELQSVRKYNGYSNNSTHSASSDANWRKSLSGEQRMRQNNDDDLLMLCQQLSGEISARTAATLEVIRLKESRVLERAAEAEQHNAMQEQIRLLNEKLADADARAQSYQQESEDWKSKYEQLKDSYNL
jgi:hypothetical protein